MLISDPFYLKTMKNFNSSPPFGLYDIYHSTDYDKQDKSYEDYRLFDDGYLES